MAITAPRILSFTTAQVKRCAVSPFLSGMPVVLSVPAAAASTVYRVYHPGTGSVTKYMSKSLNGATTTFDTPSAMNAMHSLATAITDATRLRVICLINGSPIVRVANDATPSAGQFQQTDTNTIVLGSTYAAGTLLELLVMDAADITNTGALAAGTVTEETCQSFYTATAPVSLIAGGRY